jgi:hypothetical protein
MDGVNVIPADSDYSRFHNLNTLAAEICAFDGEAKIIADKRQYRIRANKRRDEVFGGFVSFL